MSLYVSQRPPTSLLRLAQEKPYDLALVSVGFEERSSAIPTSMAMPLWGVGLTFADRHDDAYAENVMAVMGRGYELWGPDEDPAVMVSELALRFKSAVALRKLSDGSPLRIAVDISSMTRARIAAIIQASYALPVDQPVIVDILYAPAAYRQSALPLVSWVYAAPVTEHFAGWDPGADKPLLAVVGLGYEPNAAEGVIDYLTPDESVMLVPEGRDPRYREDVENVNAEVLRKADSRWEYAVQDPYQLVLALERLVLSRVHERRLLLVPLGPKIFAAVCLVVAQRLHPMVSVWRFSAGTNERAKPATAAGWVCGMRLSTRPEETPGFSAISEAEVMRKDRGVLSREA
jgi:hypothetical protein